MDTTILIFLAIAVTIIAVAVLVSRLTAGSQKKGAEIQETTKRREGRLLAMLVALRAKNRK